MQSLLVSSWNAHSRNSKKNYVLGIVLLCILNQYKGQCEYTYRDYNNLLLKKNICCVVYVFLLTNMYCLRVRNGGKQKEIQFNNDKIITHHGQRSR